MSSISTRTNCERLLSQLKSKDPELYKELREDPSTSSDPVRLKLIQIILD